MIWSCEGWTEDTRRCLHVDGAWSCGRSWTDPRTEGADGNRFGVLPGGRLDLGVVGIDWDCSSRAATAGAGHPRLGRMLLG